MNETYITYTLQMMCSTRIFKQQPNVLNYYVVAGADPKIEIRYEPYHTIVSSHVS